jgi:hypothetical protein
MIQLKQISIFALFFILFSCSSNSEDDLILPIENIEIVKYTQNVKPIIDNNCVICHGNSNPNAGLSLTNYNQVKQAVLNNGLLNRIAKPSGDPQLMPTTGRMPQQTIDLILKWQTDGLLE